MKILEKNAGSEIRLEDGVAAFYKSAVLDINISGMGDVGGGGEGGGKEIELVASIM